MLSRVCKPLFGKTDGYIHSKIWFSMFGFDAILNSCYKIRSQLLLKCKINCSFIFCYKSVLSILLQNWERWKVFVKSFRKWFVLYSWQSAFSINFLVFYHYLLPSTLWKHQDTISTIRQTCYVFVFLQFCLHTIKNKMFITCVCLGKN